MKVPYWTCFFSRNTTSYKGSNSMHVDKEIHSMLFSLIVLMLCFITCITVVLYYYSHHMRYISAFQLNYVLNRTLWARLRIYLLFITQCLWEIKFPKNYWSDLLKVRSQFPMVASMKMAILQVVAPWSAVEVNQVSDKPAASIIRVMRCLLPPTSGWWWRQHAPMKHQLPSTRLYGQWPRRQSPSTCS
jgi:hypothetical protein